MKPPKYSTGYLTPQSGKAKKMEEASYSDNDRISLVGELNDSVFQKLMNCPIKRKLVLKLIESEKHNIEAYKRKLKDVDRSEQNVSPLQKIQKNQVCESPTQLMRRRALEQQNRNFPLLGDIAETHCRSNSVTSHTSGTSNTEVSPIPFETLLDGVVAYVEVKSKGQERSDGVKALMISMGAVVKDSFTKDVTHVVFKDGSYTTFQKANLMKKHLVSVLWIEAVRTSGTRISEKKFPALGTEAYDHNISKICSQMQKEYEEIIKDELQKSLITGTPLPTTKAVIDRRRTMMSPSIGRSTISSSISHNVSSQDKEIEHIINRARINNRMTMDFVKPLSDEPELTSDDDDSRCDVIINGSVINKHCRLKDITNSDLSNMDLTNIEPRQSRNLTPNMKTNLFNIEKNPFTTPGEFTEESINENNSSNSLYNLQTPRNNRRDVSFIEETPIQSENDNIYRRLTESLQKKSKLSIEITPECTPIKNKSLTPSLHILSRNSCSTSPVAPIIHQNIIVQKAQISLNTSIKPDQQEKPSSTTTTTDMSSLKLSLSDHQKNTKTFQRKSDSVEKILGSDMSSLKISEEKSSTEMSSLKLSSDKTTSSANISLLKVSSLKTSLSSVMSSLKLSSGKPDEEKSSSANMSALQITSGTDDTDKKTTKLNDTEGLKDSFKRPSSRIESLKNEGSFNSPNNSIDLPSITLNNILDTLDTPPPINDENVTKRRRRTLFTPKESSFDDEINEIKQTSKSTTRVKKKRSKVPSINKRHNHINTEATKVDGSPTKKSKVSDISAKNPTSELTQQKNIVTSIPEHISKRANSNEEHNSEASESPTKKPKIVENLPRNSPISESLQENISKVRTRSKTKTPLVSRANKEHNSHNDSSDESGKYPNQSKSSKETPLSDGDVLKNIGQEYPTSDSKQKNDFSEVPLTRNRRKTIAATSSDDETRKLPKEKANKPSKMNNNKRKSPVVKAVSQEDLTAASPSKKSKNNENGKTKYKKTPNVVSSLSSEKRQRIRKLYDPENIQELAVARSSKLSDDEERQHKRLQSRLKQATDGVIITGVLLGSKNIDLKSNLTERDQEIIDNSDDSEIEVPTKVTRKKKNKTGEVDITVNGDRDEQSELAKEILEEKKSQQSSTKKALKSSHNSSCSSTSSSSSGENSKVEGSLKKQSRQTKKATASKSTGKLTSRRQSQRILDTVKKSNLSSPESSLLPPSTTRHNRRSTMEFQSQAEMSAKRKLKIDKLKRPSIVCTKLHKDNIMIFNQIVKKLGKFLIEDEVSTKTTHLVAGEPKRTINMLRAMAMGCWILKYEWVLKSLELGRWLSEEDFEETDFSPAVQESRLHRQAFGPSYTMDIFKEYGQIYVARGSIPRSSDVKELITLCQGKVTNILRNAVIVVGGYVHQPTVTCVKETWILDSITKYKKMPFKSYLITSDNGVMI